MEQVRYWFYIKEGSYLFMIYEVSLAHPLAMLEEDQGL
jgi:hypothetical protein